jgi:hypothetical protein
MGIRSRKGGISVASVQAMIDAIPGGEFEGLTFEGGYNASTNTPDLDTSPSGIEKGQSFVVEASGTFFTAEVEVGDVLIAKVDSASQESDWIVINKNVDSQEIELSKQHREITDGNPHGTTKDHVGLGNVDNTADADKPVSTAQQSALDGKGSASAVASNTEHREITDGNPHGTTKDHVGLDQVDNTSDADKPISSATQIAIDQVGAKKVVNASTTATLNSEDVVNSVLHNSLQTAENVQTLPAIEDGANFKSIITKEGVGAFKLQVATGDNAVLNGTKLPSSALISNDVPSMGDQITAETIVDNEGGLAFTNVKSVLFDFADGWGNSFRMGIRSVEFYNGDTLLEFTTDEELSVSATTCDNWTLLHPKFVFRTNKSKTGNSTNNEWWSDYNTSSGNENKRVRVTFTTPITFTKIVINNSHEAGGGATLGVKNTQIRISETEISSTGYLSDIEGTSLIFDGIIAQHVASDVADDQDISGNIDYTDANAVLMWMMKIVAGSWNVDGTEYPLVSVGDSGSEVVDTPITFTGPGVPANSLGNFMDLYTDEDTGIEYEKSGKVLEKSTITVDAYTGDFSNPSNINDDDDGTYAENTGATEEELIIDAGEGSTFDFFEARIRNEVAGTWDMSFEGRNDALDEWEVLGTVEGVSDSNHVDSFSFESQQSYRYLRISFSIASGSGTLKVYELDLYDATSYIWVPNAVNSLVLSGTSDPSSEDGDVNDIFINTTDRKIFSKDSPVISALDFSHFSTVAYVRDPGGYWNGANLIDGDDGTSITNWHFDGTVEMIFDFNAAINVRQLDVDITIDNLPDAPGGFRFDVYGGNDSHTNASELILTGPLLNTGNTSELSYFTQTLDLSDNEESYRFYRIRVVRVDTGNSVWMEAKNAVAYITSSYDWQERADFSESEVEWERKTEDFSVVSGNGYLVDAGVVATLPSSPANNDMVFFSPLGDMTSSSATIGRNGKSIMGVDEDMTWDVNLSIAFIYDSTNEDWRFA